MMTDLQLCHCRNCGHDFMHVKGGFILDLSSPRCPRCGSKNIEITKPKK